MRRQPVVGEEGGVCDSGGIEAISTSSISGRQLWSLIELVEILLG
jgi:hypothetical protein